MQEHTAGEERRERTLHYTLQAVAAAGRIGVGAGEAAGADAESPPMQSLGAAKANDNRSPAHRAKHLQTSSSDYLAE